MTEKIDYRGFIAKCEKIISESSDIEEKKKKDNDTKEIISNIAVGCAYTTTQCLIWGALIYLCVYENMNALESIMHVFFFGGELFFIAFFVFAIFPNALLIYDFIEKRRNDDDHKNISD